MQPSEDIRRVMYIDPNQLGKIVALIHCILGIFVGIVLLLVGVFSPGHRAMIVVAILVPFLYAAFGYIGTWVSIFVFNWAAGKVGGVPVTFTSTG
jgi:hypothetical protein